MAAKKEVDWERVELDYRAGVLSVREIGTAHGVSHTAIGKRATKEGWTRDLKAKIQAKAEALVAKREVSKEVASAKAETERQLVEANAEVIAGVRLAHRADIRRFRELALSLLREIEAETGDVGLFEELGEMLRSEDKAGQDKRNDLYRKVISSAGRIDSMKKLAETLRILVTLEREAYGLEDAGQGGQPSNELAKVLGDLIERLPA